MRSMILEQLYTGNIGAAHMPPYETESSEYFSKQVNELATQLEKKLDEQGRRLLGRLQDARNAEDSAFAYGCFIHGFKLAAQIMVEVFADPESEVRNKEQYHYSKVRPREAPDTDSEIE